MAEKIKVLLGEAETLLVIGPEMKLTKAGL